MSLSTSGSLLPIKSDLSELEREDDGECGGEGAAVEEDGPSEGEDKEDEEDDDCADECEADEKGTNGLNSLKICLVAVSERFDGFDR